MSKCIKCGAEIPEGTTFCAQCGTTQPQEGVQDTPQEETQVQPEPQPQAGPQVQPGPQPQAGPYQQQGGPQQQQYQQGGPQQQYQQGGPQQQQYQQGGPQQQYQQGGPQQQYQQGGPQQQYQQGGPQQQYQQGGPQQQYQQQQGSNSSWSRPTTIYQYRKDPQYSLSNKAAGVLCYVGWIGIIITLCMGDTKDPFVKFHLNYGLIYSIAAVVCSALQVVNAIPVLGQILSILLLLVTFGILVLDIIGLIEALDMKCTERPYLESIKLIK